MSGYVDHGWRHAPKAQGGTDPVPVSSGGGQPTMVNKYTMHGLEWRHLIDNSPSAVNGGGGFTFTRDSTAPYGGYITSSGANQDFIGFGLPLGPKGSGWAVSMWAEQGDGHGKIQIEWATVSVDEFAGYAAGSDVSIIDPGEQSLTYYHTTTGGAAPSLSDWYAGSGWGFVSQQSALVVAGDDGDMLSANGVNNGDWFYGQDMGGGGDPSVYWWIRLRVDGKNASSSGYLAKIAGLTVYRLNGNGQPIT